MGGGLVLAYSTRSPPSANVDRLAGVIASSPLLRQAKGVKASPLIVKAGSLIGKLSSTLTLKATVNPEVRRLAEFSRLPRKRARFRDVSSLSRQTY